MWRNGLKSTVKTDFQLYQLRVYRFFSIWSLITYYYYCFGLNIDLKII